MAIFGRSGRVCALIVLTCALAAPLPRPLDARAQAPVVAPGEAVEKRPEGFDIPELGRARFLGWGRRDLTGRVPGEETLIKQYLDEWEFQFETLTINSRIFAINIDVDGRYPYDITLLDTNCDGIFETKVEEKPGERVDMSIPECVFRPGGAPRR